MEIEKGSNDKICEDANADRLGVSAVEPPMPKAKRERIRPHRVSGPRGWTSVLLGSRRGSPRRMTDYAVSMSWSRKARSRSTIC